ncbi:AGAP009854-PA-like protein [Anopheles sinensis]|uniref:Gustatory receptor n=1 Tax=Anopheles sinensis TaxID=74873 RepID=A0A084W8X7_ANOSI|nr:AGAP009854-PA-like protein [Anopheles sinensis]
MATSHHYDRRFGWVYPLFQLLGLALVPLHGQSLGSLYTLTSVIVSSYVLLILCVAVYSLAYPGDLFFLSDATGTFADAIQFEILLVVPLVSLILSLAKRPLQQRIARLMDQLDGQLEANASEPGLLERFNYTMSGDVLTTVIIYNVIPAANEMFIISRISANIIWYRNWLLKVWFLMLIRLGDTLFLVHVQYVRNRYRLLNYELKQTRSQPDAITHRRLVRLKAVQNLLKDLTGDVSDRFGWQLFSVITMLFICTTIDGYWMYASLYHDGNLYKTESFLCGISPFLMFFMLFNVCQHCVDEGELTFYHLHNVLNRPLPPQTIQNFSKQLNNEKVNFSAANFFELKLSGLTTIFASITTYLVIYINFLPKTDTFNDYNKEHNLVNSEM